jgi:hypothetical protein
MTDVFSRYEDRLDKLAKLIPKDHPSYTELLTLGARLQENIAHSRRYGDTETRRAERAQILDSLNQLSLTVMGMVFVELNEEGAEQADRQKDAPARPAGQPSGQRVVIHGNVSGQIAVGDNISQSQSVTFDQRGQQVGTQTNVAGDYAPEPSLGDLRTDSATSSEKASPELTFSTDVDFSPPTPGEEEAGAKRSWFIRLRVENSGQAPAMNCFGRLLELRNEDGEHLKQFDSLNLYWTRQNKPEKYQRLDIREYGDFQYLDLAQVKEVDGLLTLRVVIPEGYRLVKPRGHSGNAGGLRPGAYYLRVAIYADEVAIAPTWFRIEWTADFSQEPPCSIEVAQPSRKK